MDFDEVMEMKKKKREERGGRRAKPLSDRKTRRPLKKGSVMREVVKQGVLDRGRILQGTAAAARKQLVELGILILCGQTSSSKAPYPRGLNKKGRKLGIKISSFYFLVC